MVALLLTALRVAIAYVPHNEQKLRTWIERQTQTKFEYSRLDARLRWYGPEVVLRDLRVVAEDGSQTLFATREGSIGLDLWNFFRTGQFVAGRVRILEPRVTIVRLADGRIRLLGLRERPADKPPFDFDRLPAGRIVIDDATVVYRDLKTGSEPLELTDLDVQLRRDRDAVVLEGSARLPEELGTRADFNVRLKGTLDEREHLDARVEVDADTVRLAGLKDFLPAQVAKPLAGSGHLHGVFALEQGTVSNLRLGFDLHDVALQLPGRAVPPIEAVRVTNPRLELAVGTRMQFPTVTKEMVERAPPPLPVEARYGSLAGDARLRRDGDGWVFRIDGLRAQAGAQRAVNDTQVWGRWTGKPVTRFGLELNVDRLDLASTWPLVLAFAPASFDRFAGLAPRGRVETLRAKVQRERAGIEPTFTVQASLVGVGVQPSGRFPGLSGVSLKLDGNDRLGKLQLRADQPVFEWPRLFREPLALERVTADGGWHREGAAWIASAKGAQLVHRQGRARVDVEFGFEKPGVSPTLALNAEVPEVDVSLVPKFVPVGRLRERTIAWLDRAFVRGIATNGRLSYRGPVQKFPFDDGEGDFSASADATNVTLDYYPGFAPLANASGTARFHNALIEADVASGELGGLRLSQARFVMADYRAPVLEIDGKGGGDLHKALAYVQASPLGPIIGDQFMGSHRQWSGAVPGQADAAGDFRRVTGCNASAATAARLHRPRRARRRDRRVACAACTRPARRGHLRTAQLRREGRGAARHDPGRSVRTGRQPRAHLARGRSRGGTHGEGPRWRRQAARIHRPAVDYRNERCDGLGAERPHRETTRRRRVAPAVRRREQPGWTRHPGAPAFRQGRAGDTADTRAARDSRFAHERRDARIRQRSREAALRHAGQCLASRPRRGAL